MPARKNADLEALRGLAIIMVILAHMWVVAPALSGWRPYFYIESGVDLFFGISGFIIVTTLLPITEPFRVFASAFWIRRVFRLWPAAIFWAALTVLFAVFFDSGGRLGTPLGLTQTAFFAAFNIANIQAAICAANGGWLPCGNSGALGHYWSLSLEEQFYWLIPFLLYFLRGKSWLFFVFAAAGLLLVFQDVEGPWAFLRPQGLCLGVAIALAWHFFRPQMLAWFPWQNRAAALTAMALAAAGFLFFSQPLLFDHYAGLSTLVLNLLVFVASVDRNYLTRNPALSAVANYIGSRSYSIYLVHLPVFCIAHDAIAPFGDSPDAWRIQSLALICAMGFILVLAELSYIVVELPLRLYGRRMVASRVRMPVAAAPAAL